MTQDKDYILNYIESLVEEKDPREKEEKLLNMAIASLLSEEMNEVS